VAGRGRTIVRARRSQILRFPPAQDRLVRFRVKRKVLVHIIPNASFEFIDVVFEDGNLVEIRHHMFLVLLLNAISG